MPSDGDSTIVRSATVQASRRALQDSRRRTTDCLTYRISYGRSRRRATPRTSERRSIASSKRVPWPCRIYRNEREHMKRVQVIAAWAAVMAGLLFAGVGVSSALADPGNGPPSSPPGQGEFEHGNSGQECKPDPQPEHGKDCDDHGNLGGVNEDHCLGTT